MFESNQYTTKIKKEQQNNISLTDKNAYQQYICIYNKMTFVFYRMNHGHFISKIRKDDHWIGLY